MTPYGEYEPTNLILLLSDNPQSPPLDTLDSRNKEPASNANPIEGIPMMKSHDIFSFVSIYIKKTSVSGVVVVVLHDGIENSLGTIVLQACVLSVVLCRCVSPILRSPYLVKVQNGYLL